MSWQDLLNANQVRAHRPSKQEMDELRSVVQRDLLDAEIPAVSTDRRFATAYNAALQLSKMAIACAGYRVSGIGHHHYTFQAVELAMGATISNYSNYFDTCRRRRNTVDYDRANIVSEQDAADLLAQVQQFQQLVETWICESHPTLA